MDSWAGAAAPAPGSGSSARFYLGVCLRNCPLWELCAGGYFLPSHGPTVEGRRFVCPLSGCVGRMCRHTGRMVPWVPQRPGPETQPRPNTMTQNSSEVTASLDPYEGQLLSKGHGRYRVSSRRQAGEEVALGPGACGEPPAPNPNPISQKRQPKPPESHVSRIEPPRPGTLLQQGQRPLACPSPCVLRTGQHNGWPLRSHLQ